MIPECQTRISVSVFDLVFDMHVEKKYVKPAP
jgi:hypothetical protein